MQKLNAPVEKSKGPWKKGKKVGQQNLLNENRELIKKIATVIENPGTFKLERLTGYLRSTDSIDENQSLDELLENKDLYKHSINNFINKLRRMNSYSSRISDPKGVNNNLKELAVGIGIKLGDKK